jgi:glycerophosphoryl diester phosphodiesterase
MAGRNEDAAPAWEVVVVVHRGQVPGYPENTLAAYRESVARGFQAIEVDLRTTADGQIVIMHDETVDRTTSGSGKVENMTFAEIRSQDAGSHAGPRFADQKVLTYQEVLEALRGTGTQLVLDIKPGAALDHERVVRLPDRAGIEQFARAGADMIRLWPPWIFADRGQGSGRSPLIERLHDLGKPVWTTADTLYKDIDPDHPREDLRELIRLGVNGIITDVPELCRDVLAAAS